MKSTLTGLLLCAIGLSAQPSKSAQEQELLKVEAEWYKAYLQSDSATMNRLEGEDMIVITPTMLPSRLKPLNKGRDLQSGSAAARALRATIVRSLEKTQVRLLGSIGIIDAIMVSVGKNEAGAETTRRTYYSSVWEKRKGAWQCINAQFTEIPEENWQR
jgi:ketosteroid isomerase-like protein